MSVIPFTLFFSLLLAGTFVLLFAREQRRRRFGSAERDSLLPLAEETAREVRADQVERGLWTRSERVQRPRSTRDEHHDHNHDHAAADACGCRTPCAGCLKRRDV